MKKIAISWQAVLVKRMAADRPNMGRSNFYDHFEFKMQNKLGSFLCKKLIRAKIGIVSFGWQPTAIGPNFCIKYFNFVL